MVKNDSEGYSAKEVFWYFDTHGKYLPCREPVLYHQVKSAKEHTNLNIKMWAEDVADGLLSPEEVTIYTKEMPEWVFSGVINQACKTLRKQYDGYIPSYVLKYKTI